MIQFAWSIYMPGVRCQYNEQVFHIWWWNGRKREAEWLVYCGKRQFWKSRSCEEWEWHPGLGCCLQPYMCLRQPGLMLTSMTHAATMPQGGSGVWTATCGHFGVQGLCHHWNHVNLSALYCHQGTWWHSVPPGQGHFWVSAPTAVRVWAYVYDSCYHRAS